MGKKRNQKFNEEPSGHLKLEKYNNQGKNLSRWIEQHSGKDRGKNHAPRRENIEITQSEETGIVDLNVKNKSIKLLGKI